MSMIMQIKVYNYFAVHHLINPIMLNNRSIYIYVVY